MPHGRPWVDQRRPIPLKEDVSRSTTYSCSCVQAHAELPISLVLGMATSAGALQQMLPVAAASVLEPYHYQLMSSMER